MMTPNEQATLDLLQRLEYLERGMEILLGERNRRIEKECNQNESFRKEMR